MNADNAEVLRSGGSSGVAGISTFMSRTPPRLPGALRTPPGSSNMDAVMHRDEQSIERAIRAGLSRRSFLRASGTAALAAMAGCEGGLVVASTKSGPRADSLILLWMAGGMAQTETFDPKQYTPFEPGMESKRDRKSVV